MKKLFISFALILLGLSVYAKQVDEATAKKKGLNFLLNNTANAFQASTDLKLVFTSETNQTIYYYVFNADHGFVIVAGDDQAIPILGYSDEGQFSTDHIPVHVSEWLKGYTSQMQYIIENNIAASTDISSKWSNLDYNISPTAPQQTLTGGATLLNTTWDQLPYYNDLCPYDYASKRHTVTGCVATTMAQIMKFWNYPSTGIGFHSYNDPSYGTQSASFGGTSYQWTNMPNVLNGANTAVATLMYQCGVSVNMTYGPSESDAYVLSVESTQKNCAEYALKTYFGYDKSLHGILRSDYSSDAAWIDTIEAEINAGRPVIYTGTGNGGGHCFVCDGYRITDNYLHFNWGWRGIYDGYFSINALNPGTGGTGAGSGSYNSNEEAIIGIQPSKALLSYNMGLNSGLNLSGTSVQYRNSFTISTNIININSGSHNFTGNFCAEIFDSSGNLVDSVVNTATSVSIGQNTGTITFSYPGSALLLPGNYNIQVYYRPSGGNWSIVSNNGYTNKTSLKVYWANTLELSTPIIATSGASQGNPLSVDFNVYNTGSQTITGVFYVRLYHFDGSSDFLVQQIRDTLQANSSFTNNLLFTNSNDTVSPGTYLLVASYSPDNGVPFQLIGSTNYQNPVKVTIAAPPLGPDPYEPNNTVDSAFDISPNFAMDSAEIRTVGANINTGSDVDFYKIEVPAGYYYTFSGNLYDLRYPFGSQKYTLDGVFSFTEDRGKFWSGTFDQSIPGTAVVNGPDTVVFKVAPIFPGATGTYQLDLKVKRSAGAAIKPESFDASNIKIFPNPAQNILNIDISNLHEKMEQIILVDMTGKQVFNLVNPGDKTMLEIPVSNQAQGMYILKLKTNNGLITTKISITK